MIGAFFLGVFLFVAGKDMIREYPGSYPVESAANFERSWGEILFGWIFILLGITLIISSVANYAAK